MKRACVSPRVMLAAAVLLVLAPLSLAQDAPGAREDFDTGIDNTSQLVVMLTGQLGAAATFGAGILFGRDHERLYIVTANHVVRRGTVEAANIRVTFRSMRDKSFAGKLLGQADRESDIAVVAVEGWARQGVDGCRPHFDRLGDPATLQRGNTVYAIGNPNGEPWRVPLSERLYDARADQLAFESAFIAVGSSGGALLDQYTRIVGMVRKDDPPTGSAIPISVVLPLVSKWGYPVQLRAARPDGSSPLHAAAVSGDIDRIRAELAEACADPNVRDIAGRTPVQRAVDAERLEAVRALIQGGANVKDNRSRGKITALHYAAGRHNVQMATVLLDAGAEVNARDNLGSPPLVYVHPQSGDTPAVAQTKAEFVRLLLRAGADVNARPTYGDGLLHQALEARNREILAAVLEAHADVNLKGRSQLPLELAAERGDMDTIKLLLQAGADARAGDDYRNALSIALHRKNGPLAALLLNSGASLSNVRSIDVLQEAIREGWNDVAKLVLGTGADVNLLRESQTVNGDGSMSGGTPRVRPLIIALEVKKPEMVALLIANKANVNLPDEDREMPLHLAACADGGVLVKLLLDAGARVNARNALQATPLHKAVSCRNEAAVKLLLHAGAAVNVEDINHSTPLNLAKGTSLEPLLRPHAGR